MTHKVKVTMLRSPVFYWDKACAFTREKQGFTVAELAGCTCGVANSTIQQWVNAMKRQGELKVVGSRPSIAGKTAHVYAVVHIRATAPVVRRPDFIGMAGRAQQQLWNAMRTLPNFSLQELAVAASTEERPVSRNTANKYVAALARAGLVAAIEPPAPGRQGRTGAIAGMWRLLKHHNRGPLAPQILQARFVFDPNRDEIVGESEVLS
jgi:hypothetical protein